MAKKKKKSRAPGVDPNEQRRQRLEARRQAKAEAIAAQRRARTRERIVRWVVIAAIAAFSVWFLFLRGQAPDAIAGHRIEHFGIQGGGEHTEQVVTYESTPPVAGPHSQRWADCGTHSSQLSNENLVHTLEHGAVGIVYAPETSVEDIEAIEELARSYDSHTFSAPYAGMETNYAVLAWGHIMRLDEIDEAAVREFIDTFRQGGDAPEAFQDCPNTSQESAAATPTPAATPSVVETDAGSGDGGAGGGDKDGGGKDKKKKGNN